MRLYLLLLACLVNIAHAEDFSANVIAVLDGDTVLVRRASGPVKIRLADIDAPEKTQTFGETSRRALAGMVLGKQVNIRSQAVDQYGRMVAHLGINGLDVNTEQIRRGMAWEYSHFHSNRALIALQEKAKNTPLGLWAQNNPTPPWEWRKQHPGTLPTPTSKAAPGCAKKHCSQMISCAEARHGLEQCGFKSLDRDGDGVPCETLCGGKKR